MDDNLASGGPAAGSPPDGPAFATVAFGAVCVAAAVAALVVQLTGASVDWGAAAPLAVTGIGVILVLVGLAGVVLRPRRGQTSR